MRPSVEAVVDRFGRVAVSGELCSLFPQPGLQLNDPGAATLLAHAQTLLRRETVDLTFDGEQNIDALDRFGRDRRLAEPREVKNLRLPCA